MGPRHPRSHRRGHARHVRQYPEEGVKVAKHVSDQTVRHIGAQLGVLAKHTAHAEMRLVKGMDERPHGLHAAA